MNIKMPQLPEILDTSIEVATEHFRIEKVHLRFSNGQERYYERMLGSKPGAVMIVPVVDDNLLLVREYCGGTHSYELGFPKGCCEAGENWKQAAERELREETGYRGSNYTFLRSVNSAPSFFSTSIDIILAEDLLYDPLSTGDEPEPMELVRWPIKSASDLLLDEGFKEARCIAALASAMQVRHWQ